jgi:glutamate dehydrogenase (NAD(P)+)
MRTAANDSPVMTRTITDGDRVLGYVVIDSTIDGRASGGLRMMPDIDEAEIRGLAHTMTLKYGFLGLRNGGAKAGMIGDPDSPVEERRRIAADFGKAIAPLLRDRIYLPATDMGTGPEELRYLRKGAGLKSSKSRRSGPSTGDYTGLTVWIAAQVAARYRGLDPAKATAAIEGFGNVGRALARLFVAGGTRVVAVSTVDGALYNPKGLDIAKLTALSKTYGDRVIEHYPNAERLDPEALLELPVDILSPCARHNSIHRLNVAKIDAQILAPGANTPITMEAERVLFDRGVICLPDFVANSGGVLGGTMRYSGIDTADIDNFIRDYLDPRISGLLTTAAEQKVVPRVIAEEISRLHIKKMTQPGAGKDLLSRIYKTLAGQYRLGRIPGKISGAVAIKYFHKNLM